MKKYLLILTGPTAVGKTALSLHLAQHFQTPILSCDSRQFFRELNIGTAKPTAKETKVAQHFFINSHSIFEPYTVGDFERDALQLLEVLFQKHDIVIMTGGSGLYIRAICEGLDKFPETPPNIRAEIAAEYQEKGISYLQNELQKLDKTYFDEVDIHNPQRMMRALEVCKTTGKAFSDFRNKTKEKRPFESIKIALQLERELLYERINQRVEMMLLAGLEAEAKEMYEHRHLNALQTVGYKEWFDYFEGYIDQKEAIRLIKRNTRRYAKRQLTWLRKDKEFVWFSPFQLEEITTFVEKKMQV
ncbi:MAG: tRNA (adenosine(37)-N6)-dimethylallyltransferase MiaA [Chitinophagales bacterium]